MSSRSLLLALAAGLATGCTDECFVDGLGCSDDRGPIIALAASSNRTCGIRARADAAGPLTCWGAKQEVPSAGVFTILAIGELHTCAFGYDYARDLYGVQCTGDSASNDGAPVPTPTFSQIGNITSIAAGAHHTCIVRPASSPGAEVGTVCWGDNSFGQAPRSTVVRASVVVAGSAHTCAVDVVGAVTCYGRNDVGQAAPPPGPYDTITAGDMHSCGIRFDGTAVCWGLQPEGILPPSGVFIAISAGGSHTCAIRDGGAVECWGNNDDGQATPPAGKFRLLASGARHTCGIRVGGGVACWGSNDHGQANPP